MISNLIFRRDVLQGDTKKFGIIRSRVDLATLNGLTWQL